MNPYVIEYWLSVFVFPRECKRFAQKISCSAWDLASPRSTLPVIGFSGSEDSKVLYPARVYQITQPEAYRSVFRKLTGGSADEDVSRLPIGFSSQNIVDILVEHQCTVLLDAGAIATCSGMNNQTLAKLWMEADKIKKGCFYIEEQTGAWMIWSQGRAIPYHQSPFEIDLSACCIFLDQPRTRGIHLQLAPSLKR
jgi:hypothetical protein